MYRIVDHEGAKYVPIIDLATETGRPKSTAHTVVHNLIHDKIKLVHVRDQGAGPKNIMCVPEADVSSLIDVIVKLRRKGRRTKAEREKTPVAPNPDRAAPIAKKPVAPTNGAEPVKANWRVALATAIKMAARAGITEIFWEKKTGELETHYNTVDKVSIED